MLNVAELVTFLVYFVLLLSIGWFFYNKTGDLSDYLIGGRKMNRWVTALSAQASDMSGWLLMGLPGAVFLLGPHQAWIAIGLFVGTVVNWILVAPRLRVHTEKTNSITLPSFFEARFKDPTGAMRLFSAAIILFFFTIYASSGLVAAGRLFESMFSIPFTSAVLIGGAIIVVYTFLGGFLAVSWTDFIQGLLMLAAVIIVPLIAFVSAGGVSGIAEAMAARDISPSIIPPGSAPLLVIISTAAWGLGYFGQPHILARFMGIRSVKDIPSATGIAVVWVAFSLSFAVFIGLIGIPLFPGLEGPASETVFIHMIRESFVPWIGGIFLAAILSAIMSTIDSQLLVSSSALTEDLYRRFSDSEPSDTKLMWFGRVSVVIIAVVAMILALSPGNTVLGLVSYAWGGFGAAFGPVILMALFSRKTTWKSALSGMLIGTAVLIVWERVGLNAYMYEIVPGFIANFATMLIVNAFSKQEDAEILSTYDSVQETLEAE